MAELEDIPPLRSLNSNNATFIEFINRSSSEVTAWWLSFRGTPVSHVSLGPDETHRLKTHLTHPWIFRASDGSKLLVNSSEVYFPTPVQYGDDGNLLFHPVIVTAPVYSLQEYCLKLIRKLVRKEDVNKLEIPEFLRKEVSRTPNLQQEIQILAAQRLKK